MLTGMPWCGRKEQKNNLINTFFFKKKILKTQQSKIKLRSKEKKVQNSATCCRSALQKKNNVGIHRTLVKLRDDFKNIRDGVTEC